MQLSGLIFCDVSGVLGQFSQTGGFKHHLMSISAVYMVASTLQGCELMGRDERHQSGDSYLAKLN